jgi:hypothetical protein
MTSSLLLLFFLEHTLHCVALLIPRWMHTERTCVFAPFKYERRHRNEFSRLLNTNYDNYDENESSSTLQSSPSLRSRLTDRIRELDTIASSQNAVFENTTPPIVDDDYYCQVKQGIVQIKSKEQHAYVVGQGNEFVYLSPPAMNCLHKRCHPLTLC